MKCDKCGCDLSSHPAPKPKHWIDTVLETLLWFGAAGLVLAVLLVFACGRTYCGGPVF